MDTPEQQRGLTTAENMTAAYVAAGVASLCINKIYNFYIEGDIASASPHAVIAALGLASIANTLRVMRRDGQL
jgi:hypothetical protein